MWKLKERKSDGLLISIKYKIPSNKIQSLAIVLSFYDFMILKTIYTYVLMNYPGWINP